ncbi:rCG22893 [Rattus norvegicus]|uniref:RCG22893 n=1 Tax=Rattus norvegicus TaxID=10116 RepID=A6KPB3_RAT|nr:rCG22893 [Rattus norvegicus]
MVSIVCPILGFSSKIDKF